MYPRAPRSGAEMLLRDLIRFGLVILIGYLIITALCGFHLGRQIYNAKSNPWIGLGSTLIGRDATESFAIQQSNFPNWITESPAFWIALRASE